MVLLFSLYGICRFLFTLDNHAKSSNVEEQVVLSQNRYSICLFSESDRPLSNPIVTKLRILDTGWCVACSAQSLQSSSMNRHLIPTQVVAASKHDDSMVRGNLKKNKIYKWTSLNGHCTKPKTFKLNQHISKCLKMSYLILFVMRFPLRNRSPTSPGEGTTCGARNGLSWRLLAIPGAIH